MKVIFRSSDDEECTEVVKVIDWETPENNDFFLASQFWISGDYGRKRADLLGFVNGIPLVFIELKASHRALENAYKHNLSDYKTTIPQLFWYNAGSTSPSGRRLMMKAKRASSVWRPSSGGSVRRSGCSTSWRTSPSTARPRARPRS